MATPQPRPRSVDEILNTVVYKRFTEGVSKIAKEMAKLIIKNAGIPAPFGKPLVELYGNYGRHFAQLYFATAKSEAMFVKIRQMARTLQKHVEMVERVIKMSPVPEIEINGLVVLLTALLDSKVATQFLMEQKTLKRKVNEIVDMLDHLLKSNAQLDVIAARAATDGCAFQKNLVERNDYDKIFGRIRVSYATSRDLCYPADQLLMVSSKLVSHREDWAALINRAPIANFRTHKQLVGACNCVEDL